MILRNSRLLRLAYVVEFTVLALPLLIMMAPLALVGAVAFGVISISPAAEGHIGLLPAAGMLICLSGLAAMFKFFRLSIVYVFGSRTRLRGYAREFRLGLALAAPALVFTLGASVAMGFSDPKLWPLLPFLSGMVLFIPITHLWLALRDAERAIET
ncbi:hypothetical protein ACRQ1B_10535 [Rhizobium panacihumi]|uniref:hypothetical protein n=1 Tax=Rhizobium panacihumi TaxID=2008450 RepID=UPI003D7BC84A